MDETGGITAIRSACPSVAVPAPTGDLTLFDPVTSKDASALDVTAVLTNVRSTCSDAGDTVLTTVTFQVEARRLPYRACADPDAAVFRHGGAGRHAVVAKRVGHVDLVFAPGAARAVVQGTGTASVERSAATLSPEVRKLLTERRKAGNQDAADRPADSSRSAPGRANRDVRGAGRLPADAGPAEVQRDAVTRGDETEDSLTAMLHRVRP